MALGFYFGRNLDDVYSFLGDFVSDDVRNGMGTDDDERPLKSEEVNTRVTEEALGVIKAAEQGIEDHETRWEIIHGTRRSREGLEEVLKRYKESMPFQGPGTHQRWEDF